MHLKGFAHHPLLFGNVLVDLRSWYGFLDVFTDDLMNSWILGDSS